MDESKERYLRLLSKTYPTAAAASTEIVSLSAVLNLPKGTEFFASDIHGEYEAFSHLLRNGAGTIRLKIDELFDCQMTPAQKQALATLVYYPREKMAIELAKATNEEDWYAENLLNLVALARLTARKYTRNKVRKALPAQLAPILEELMAEYSHGTDKKAYYAAIIYAVIRTGGAADLVEALCLLIQRLSIDHLHIIGDIFDRGPAPDAILDLLMGYHSVDVQWGNHDIVWMGASLGQPGCIAHVVRNCARYGNLSILSEAYGIDIMPLATFALSAYADDPCVAFGLKGSPLITPAEYDMEVKIQKAMAILQFKVEGHLIDANPSFGLEGRKLLHLIDYQRGTITLDGVEYPLIDTVFPTVDPADPYRLTPEEEAVMAGLQQAFAASQRLRRHVRFLLESGSLYKVFNGNLLLHASVPLHDDGSLREADVFGRSLKGRALYDELERYVRAGFYSADPLMRQRGRDLMWYLWLGEDSPLFAKSKMATFESYLIADKAARREVKDPFYEMLDDEQAIDGVLRDFGLDPASSHIICGHVPVKVKDGEDPVKCGGKVLTIDGGFSKAYQPTTGIAGYTLISNSYGFILVTLDPLDSIEAAIRNETDIHGTRRVVERVEHRQMVADTDAGARIRDEIAALDELLEAYRVGLIPERHQEGD